jgi:hypothetical protein
MNSWDINLEAFCSWLCLHEHDVVGYPGTFFRTPLSVWLSEVSGHTYGMDGMFYGRASYDYCSWLLLPRWAEVFTAWMERLALCPITGYQALDILARVEMALFSRGSKRQAIRGRKEEAYAECCV